MPDLANLPGQITSAGLSALGSSANAHARVSIIIPTRNGADLVHECLNALWHQTFHDYEIIVVDDASTDNTYEVLLGYPEVKKIVRLPGERGHGFVAAVNAGLAEAVGDIIVLLNNDAVPDPTWLEELLGGFDRHPGASMAASRLMLYSKPDHFHSTGDYYGLDGVPNSRGVWQLDTGQYDQEEEVFGPCAAAAAYKRDVLIDIADCGGTEPPGSVLDPQLWMYCEDVDLNLRARLRGYRTVYVPTARVLHRLSATGGGALASYYVGRNFIYLLAKDIPARIIRRNIGRIAKAQAHFALEAVRHIRYPASRARLRGIIAGLLTWPRVLPARKRLCDTARITPSQFERVITRFGGREAGK
ncbi:MAG: glycosyltransferase family 2 protein [Chloroflexota bacterium]